MKSKNLLGLGLLGFAAFLFVRQNGDAPIEPPKVLETASAASNNQNPTL